MRTVPAYLLLAATFLLALGARASLDPGPGDSDRTERLPAVPPDTVRDTVRAGELYLRNLPARRNGRAVTDYRAIEPPALSWLVDRSLFWNTRALEPGRASIRLLARTDSTTDTLIVELTLTEQ